jgi:hypothetical protein
MEGHAVHDDAFYVPKELFEKWAENDPIDASVRGCEPTRTCPTRRRTR